MAEKASLNPALKDFWKAPARYRVLYGGRSSSKSWDAAGFAIFLACNYKIRFLCARQFQNKIAESVYTLLKIQAERFGIDHEFKFTDNSIIHRKTKSEFIFYGIARNIDEIKSTESIDVLWLEEAHLLTAEQWKIIEPTIRKQGSQIWIIFNPRFASDFAYRRFVIKPPPKSIVRLINWPENPFLSDDMRDVILNAKEEDEDEYNNIYMGVPLTDDARVIIKRSWIEAAIDAHITLGFEAKGRNVIGFDVADDGDDKCANVYAVGSVAMWSDEWKGGEDELLKSCSQTYRNASERGASIRYDCIGVGAGAGAKFDELNQATSGKHVAYAKFNAGDSVNNPDRFYGIIGVNNKYIEATTLEKSPLYNKAIQRQVSFGIRQKRTADDGSVIYSKRYPRGDVRSRLRKKVFGPKSVGGLKKRWPARYLHLWEAGFKHKLSALSDEKKKKGRTYGFEGHHFFAKTKQETEAKAKEIFRTKVLEHFRKAFGK